MARKYVVASVIMTLALAAAGALVIYGIHVGAPGQRAEQSPDRALTAVATNEVTTPVSIAEDRQTSYSDDPTVERKTSELTTLSSGSGSAVIFAFLSLSLTTAASLALSFYLYRWRRTVMAGREIVVPEKFEHWLNSLDKRSVELVKGYNQLARFFGDGVSRSVDEHRNTREQVERLMETFMTLQNTLDIKDQELARYKAGYDAQLTTRFLRRFIKVDQALSDVLSRDAVERGDIDDIRRMLTDALEECGVEPFAPTIGEDFRVAEGIADGPKLIATAEHENAFKIAEVLDYGYRLRTADNTEVLIPARVAIYAPQT